jgi:hypothetical protein
VLTQACVYAELLRSVPSVQEQRAREVFHTTRWEWRQATREGGSPLLQRLGMGVADYAHAKMLASLLRRSGISSQRSLRHHPCSLSCCFALVWSCRLGAGSCVAGAVHVKQQHAGVWDSLVTAGVQHSARCPLAGGAAGAHALLGLQEQDGGRGPGAAPQVPAAAAGHGQPRRGDWNRPKLG